MGKGGIDTLDQVTRNMIKEILRLAEMRLGRKPTSDEKERLSRPRSYMALEMIIDTLKADSPPKTGSFEAYITNID